MAAVRKLRLLEEKQKTQTPAVNENKTEKIGNFGVRILRSSEESTGILFRLESPESGRTIGNFVLADVSFLDIAGLEFRSPKNEKIFPCPERGFIGLKDVGLCLIGVVGNLSSPVPVLSADKPPKYADLEISSKKFPCGVVWRDKLVAVRFQGKEVRGSEILKSIDSHSYLKLSDTQEICITADPPKWNTTLQYFSSPFPAEASDLVEVYHPLKLHPFGNFKAGISDSYYTPSMLRAAPVPFLVLQLFRDERIVKLAVLQVLGELMSTDFHDRSDARQRYIHEVRLHGGGHAMIDIMQRASDAGDEKLYIEAAKCFGHLVAQHREFLAKFVSHLNLFPLIIRTSQSMRRVQSAVCNVHLLAAMMQVSDVSATGVVDKLVSVFITYMESNIPVDTIETIVFCLGKLLSQGFKLDKADVRRLLAVRQKLLRNASLSASFDQLILVKLSHAD